MPVRRQTRKKKKKKIFLITGLILLVALCLGGVYLNRTLSAKDSGKLQMFTVERGTIETYKSFSATLNVENSETISNTEGVTTIKELYVKAGQTVNKGDTLIMLGTGKIYEASISGTVNEMRFKKGDYIWPNVTLVQISDLEHLEIQIQVDEYDVKKVEAGQKCFVTIVPLSLEIETVITHVNRMSASNGRVAYYPVTAKLEVPDSVLPGMTVSVRMADETAENVLILPVAAISFDEDEKPFVYRKNGENMQKIPVETGLSDGMQIEIRNGLSEGEQIYAPVLSEEEETPGILTKLLRQIFGTRKVFNEEKAVRGPRQIQEGRSGANPPGNGANGETGPKPQTEGTGTPETAPQGGRPEQAETTSERSRPENRPDSVQTDQSESGEDSSRSGNESTESGGQRRIRGTSEDRQNAGTVSSGSARSEQGTESNPEKGSSQRAGSGRGRNESAEENAQ